MKHKNHPTIFSRAALTLLLMLMASVTWAQGIGTDYYTLTLDPNYDGGSSYIVPNIASGSHITLNEDLTPTRSGYSCIGWATTPSGDVVYAVGSTITVNSNLTLYAKWELGVTIGSLKYKVTNESLRTMELTGYSGDKPTGSLTIPASIQSGNVSYSVTSIGQGVFYNCYGLTSITIPASVTTIGQDAFAGSHLATVSFGAGSQLTTIGDAAFYNCWNLPSITLPASVTSIGQEAFSSCSGLTTVNFALGSQLTTIGNGAFYKTGLTSITIPASVTTIGQSAFSYCSGLTSVSFASGSQLTTIGNGAFYESGLTSITIPASVTTIGDNPFASCSNMTSITVDGSNPNFKDIDGVLYSKDGKIIISYPIGKTGASYTIPDGVTTIGPSAFQEAGLASITFPASITAIGQAAFWSNNLASVTLNSNPSIGTSAFYLATVTMNLMANNVGSDYWMTFYNDGCDFQADANTTVYKAKISGSNLALTAVEDRIVTAGNAVILKSTGNPVMTKVSDGSSDDYSNNDLQGVMEETATPENCYTLANGSSGVGFYKYSGTKIGIGKAYLIYSGSAARTFYSFSDDATAIEEVKSEGVKSEKLSADGWFTLDGRRLSSQPTQKGIYVKQGQKIIVK